MKCSSCQTLLAGYEAACPVCNVRVLPPSARAAAIPVPGWAYVFALACGVIPVLSLGGFVPAMIGIGGASSCIKISSTGSLHGFLRVLLCIVITIGCWILFGGFVLSVAATTKKH
jgi:hypothetical protein